MKKNSRLLLRQTAWRPLQQVRSHPGNNIDQCCTTLNMHEARSPPQPLPKSWSRIIIDIFGFIVSSTSTILSSHIEITDLKFLRFRKGALLLGTAVYLSINKLLLIRINQAEAAYTILYNKYLWSTIK